MSKYTTEVRWICEMKSAFTEAELSFKTPDEIIAAAAPNIFNFSFPIFDESHRQDLECKILRHYYTREIAAETVALWQLWMNGRLNDIMPKYNKLYQAESMLLGKELKNIDVQTDTLRTDDLLRTDDFTRTDDMAQSTEATRTDNLADSGSSTRTDNLTETYDGTRTDNLTEETTGSGTEKRKFSDTPQGSVTFNEVNNNDWLTDYTETTTDTEGERTNTGTVDDDSTTRKTGTVGMVESQTHTGTQRNVSETENTGTQNNAGTSANTGTQTVNVTEVGYRGSKIYAELIEAYSQKVLNIDMMIIRDLKDLFFLLW